MEQDDLYLSANGPVTNQFALTNSGNVGIGTATPDAQLQLRNTVANKKIVLYDTAGNDHQFYGFGINSGILRYQVSGATANHVFYSGATTTTSKELMRIEGGGNVGIGTSAPLAKLQVESAASNSQRTLLLIEPNSGGNTANQAASYLIRSRENVSGGTSNGVFTVSGTGAGFFAGNVGIGNATPTAPLTFANTVASNKIVLYDPSEGTSNHFLYGFGVISNAIRYQSASDHAFFSAVGGGTEASNEIMRLSSSGNVGIGTYMPDEKLTLVGALKITAGSSNGLDSQGTYITWNDSYLGNGGGLGITGFHNNGGTGSGGFTWSTNAGVSDANTIMKLNNVGYLGFTANNPAYPITMPSGARVTTEGVWTNASDARLKSNIQKSKYGLAEVLKLRAVDYTMNIDKSKQVGFIAQEVRNIVPEVVNGVEGDLAKGETLGISYGNLVPVLTKAVQEQQQLIEKLTKQVELLTSKIDAIEKKELKILLGCGSN